MKEKSNAELNAENERLKQDNAKCFEHMSNRISQLQKQLKDNTKQTCEIFMNFCVKKSWNLNVAKDTDYAKCQAFFEVYEYACEILDEVKNEI